MTEVLVTHPRNRLDQYFGVQATRALEASARVHFNPYDRELTLDELARLAGTSDFIISYRGTAGPPELFAALPRLKAFVRCATDIRNIDVDSASRSGVLVTRTGAGFVVAVAEWVMGVMVDLSRQISAHTETYHQGKVSPPMMGRELRGSTLGVIGYGQIGRYVCQLARAFGMRVLVADPHRSPDEQGLSHSGFERLLKESDYVVCLAEANADTEDLMDEGAFAGMKRDAFFINASRGNLVDEDALLRALERGQLAGCALDVGRAEDQMPSDELARHPLVLATPHIGGLTRPAIDHQALATVEQVRCLLQGRVPEGAVNLEHASRCAFRPI